jgi:TM2 domain-containing membrane protein YozV
MKKLLTVLSIIVLVSGTVLASFPVKNTNQTEQTQSTVSTSDANAISINNAEASNVVKNEMKKNKKSSNRPDEQLIMLLLWFFLGGFAAHRWYAGKPTGWNILFILTAGGCLVWAIFDLIHIIKGDFK